MTFSIGWNQKEKLIEWLTHHLQFSNNVPKVKNKTDRIRIKNCKKTFYCRENRFMIDQCSTTNPWWWNCIRFIVQNNLIFVMLTNENSKWPTVIINIWTTDNTCLRTIQFDATFYMKESIWRRDLSCSSTYHHKLFDHCPFYQHYKYIELWKEID